MQCKDKKLSKGTFIGFTSFSLIKIQSALDIAVTHYLSRLASEGVQTLLRPLQSRGVRGQAWGCVSLSDVLLMLDVKYDVVTHLLHVEMLCEHHSE